MSKIRRKNARPDERTASRVLAESGEVPPAWADAPEVGVPEHWPSRESKRPQCQRAGRHALDLPARSGSYVWSVIVPESLIAL